MTKVSKARATNAVAIVLFSKNRPLDASKQMKKMKKLVSRGLNWALHKRGLTLVSTKYERAHKLKAEQIPGWFTAAECEKLYALGLLTSGPILEIGHFLGRSTACLCEAIRDSGKNRVYNSYDLGFISAEEFKEHYNSVHQKDVPVPPLFNEVFSQKTTTTTIATKNLKSINLESHVRLISGNFINLDHQRYDLIFCDAVHEPHEIELNIPHIIEHSAPHCVWAFHDMNDGNIDLVLRLARARFVERVHSLGIFLYLG